MIHDDSADAAQEELFESLLIAYDEALARGDAPPDERLVPPRLQARLSAALACVSLLARTKQAGGGGGANVPPAADSSLDAPSALRGPSADNPSADASGLLPLKPRIGRFEVLREIGRGGHGVVFLAVDPRLRRLVALKVPRPEVLITPDLHRRFLREGRAASALAHPNLVPVFEVGDDGPLCYIAAGYCEGPSLAKWLKEQASPLPWQESAELVARLAEAAAHAHARGIVHRDIKPANVLLAPAEAGSSGVTPLFGRHVVPCLTDFGLARLMDEDASDRTRTGTMLGTPAYMAPEQADGRTEEIGPATDVYALGAILYELLIGQPPFRGANDLETLRLVSAAQIAPLSALRAGLPRDLEAICLKSLASSPSDRYPTASALAADLRRVSKGEPTEARPLGRLRKTARWIRRRPVRCALLVALVSLIAALAGGARWYSQRLAAARQASRLAQTHRDDLRSAVALRSAWQAFNSDNAAQARSLLRRMDADLGAGVHGFAWHLLNNLTQDAELVTLRGHTGDVYHVVFSPDGASLATASQDRTVRLWDAATGKSIATLTGHSDEVNAVAWSPDGNLLASASDDGTVRLWDAEARVAIKSLFQGDRGPIVSLAFSYDGDYLASGDDHGLVVLSDTSRWKTAKTIETGGGRVDGLALTRDGASLATATEDRGVLVWDLSELSGEIGPPAGSSRLNRWARGVTFDRRGRLVCCGRGWAFDWNWQVDDEPRPFYSPPDYLNSIAFCGGGLAATAGHDGVARVFDPATDELRQTLLGHAERIWCVASSPDGWCLATASADDTVMLWAIPEAKSVSAYTQATALSHVAFARDGQTFIAAGDAGIARWRLRSVRDAALAPAWELADNQTVDVPPIAAHDGPSGERGMDASCRDLAVSPDGALAAICRDHSAGVSLIDLRTGNLTDRLLAEPDARSRAHARSEASHRRPVHTEAIAFSPDGRTLAEAVGKSIRFWNVAERRIERRMAAKDVISAIEFSADGRRLALAIGERLELWDTATRETIDIWQAHGSRVNALAFSADGLLASAAQDRLVRLWNGTTGEAVATFSGHRHGVAALSFSPDGRLVASGGADEVKLWSLLSYEEIATLKGFPGGVNGLAFSPTHLILAAVGRSEQAGHVRLWCAAGPDTTWQPLVEAGTTGRR